MYHAEELKAIQPTFFVLRICCGELGQNKGERKVLSRRTSVLFLDDFFTDNFPQKTLVEQDMAGRSFGVRIHHDVRCRADVGARIWCACFLFQTV